ncbi:hypothetical protein GEMRC1_011787 [Eukaryota sp. GEM-RC1]
MRTITVFGATGHQGVNCIRRIFESPQASKIRIKACCRNITGNEFQRLPNLTDLTKFEQWRNQHLECVKLDAGDPDAVDSVLQNTDCVVLIQNPFLLDDDFQEGCRKESRIGLRVISQAINHGVKDFVYSSVNGAGLSTEVPHFFSKKLIENELQRRRDRFRSVQIIRPCFFMENLQIIENVKQKLSQDRMLCLPFDGSMKLPLISFVDVGKALGDCALNPHQLDRHNGIIELCSEEISAHEMAHQISVSFQQCGYEEFPLPMQKMFSLYSAQTIHPSVEVSWKIWPSLMTFRDWASTVQWGSRTNLRAEIQKEIGLPEKQVSAKTSKSGSGIGV